MSPVVPVAHPIELPAASPRLTCIIPAFNEAPRIRRVLDVALATPEVDEVIVVDDGSSDGTSDVVRALLDSRAPDAQPRLQLIRQPRNGGKTRAVATGLAAARGDFVLFLDSDLLGLKPDHLTRLAQPVLSGRTGASLSLRGNAPAPWRAIGLDYISGERVMPRDLMTRHLDELADLPRFGLEVFMNRLWLQAHLHVAVVSWPDVASPLKSEKYGALAGLKADAGMMRDIFRTVGLGTVLRQIFRLRRARA